MMAFVKLTTSLQVLMTPTTVLLVSLFVGICGKHIVSDTGGLISEDFQNPVSTPSPRHGDFPANFSLYLLPLRYPLQNMTELQIDSPYINVDWERFSRSRVVDFSDSSRLPRAQEEFTSTFVANPNGQTIFSLHPDDSRLQKPLAKLSQMPSPAENIVPSTAAEVRPILQKNPSPFGTDSLPQGADTLLRAAYPLAAPFVLTRITPVFPVTVPDSTPGVPELSKDSFSITRPLNIKSEDLQALASHSESSFVNSLEKASGRTSSVTDRLQIPQNPPKNNELPSNTPPKLRFTIARDFPPIVNDTHVSHFIIIQPDVRSKVGSNSITPGVPHSYRDDRTMFDEMDCIYVCHERSDSNSACIVDVECCSKLFGNSDNYKKCLKMEILANALNDTMILTEGLLKYGVNSY